MDKNPLLVWVENNRKKEGFGKSLVQLLGYACTDWIRRECSASLTGTDGLAWFLAKAPAEIPMGEWVQSPEEHAEAIVDFCERSKTAPIPESLKMEFPKVLDLRGVACPGNSVRSRLVMAGFPVKPCPSSQSCIFDQALPVTCLLLVMLPPSHSPPHNHQNIPS